MIQDINTQYRENLNNIFALIEDEQIETACSNYIDLIKEIEAHIEQKSDDNLDAELCAQVYFTFAQLLIQLSEFESGLHMIMAAQQYKVLNQSIDDFLKNVFILPNIDEFKANYKANLAHFNLTEAIEFDSLSYFPIPTLTENEFFFYNKSEMMLYGKYNLDQHQSQQSESIKDSFSAYTAIVEWNIASIANQVKQLQSKNKKITLIAKDYPLFLSSLQAFENQLNFITLPIQVLDSFNNFKNYYMNSSSYLPRNIIGLSEHIESLELIIKELHEHRLTTSGRDGQNVLLSICIPSYNRGQRAKNNVLHTLTSHYDEEIEVIVSNNGTDNDTKNIYEELSTIEDSRFIYHLQPENLGISLNVCTVCEKANGKYLIVLSDEDYIDLKQLDKLLDICHNNYETLAVVRSSYETQGKVQHTGLFKKGKDAELNFMMTSNYISGLIFNKNLLAKSGAIDYVKIHQDNNACYYYPHMVMELFLGQSGDILGIDEIFINEGKAETTEFETTSIDKDSSPKMPTFSTIENRIKQLHGFYDVIDDLPITQNNFELKREMTLRIITKTAFLVSLSSNVYYKKTNSNIFEFFCDAYTHGKEVLEKLYSTHFSEENLRADTVQLGKIVHHYLKQV